MRYGLLFLILALLAGYAATSAETWAPRIVLSMSTLALCQVAAAYLWNQPALLLKDSSGTQPWWAWILLWPYYGLVWLSYWSYRMIDRRAPFTEIAPGVWLSRRLTGRDARTSGVRWVAALDLAAEFERTSMPDVAYLSLPVLDATAPTRDQLRKAIGWLNNHRNRGPVFVHCALGHGRSASVIIAWLVSSGLADDVDGALTMVRQLRPGVGLKPCQLSQLRDMFSGQRTR